MTITSCRDKRAGGSAGFTLIELMVTIVVAAILAAIAIPSYTNQMRKSRRTEAKQALLDMAAREERYFATNSAYSSTPSNLGYSGTFPINIGNNYYQISACVSATASVSAACSDAGTAAAFVLTATPINGQTSDSVCGTYTLDSTGAQNVTGTAGATTCWN
jgi:type IV pilus assembly protein PilE